MTLLREILLQNHESKDLDYISFPDRCLNPVLHWEFIEFTENGEYGERLLITQNAPVHEPATMLLLSSELINNTVFVLYGRKVMPMRSKSQTITKSEVGRRLPKKRPPTHPGEMLLEEFIKPLALTQTELAQRLGISYPRLNEVIKGRRSVTPDTALRLSHVLGMSADFWLGLQQDWDLWHAMNSPQAIEIKRLKPIPIKVENIT